MSINLLPREEKKHIKRMYKSRRLATASWFLVALIGVSVILLTPLYLLSENIELLAENTRTQAGADSDFDIDSIEDQIYEINRKARTLETVTSHLRVYAYISDITEDTREGISITGIAFSGGGEEQTIDLVGTADTRDILLALRRDLEQKEYTNSVELPVSNFAQNVDIDFSITLTLEHDE